ncbi:MAG: 2-aminoethylphosphonate--pyruvate transaminase [Alphaproteobacteria bacterium MarineAlpha5_Bin10]|nr:MAG: 2-aminoethylphosphonate--pyruvate transaminase [Alphaproteobacteria bacterium MarineAlpha5_Bin10]|tara:strand:- start:8580 stop:9680 length:1101 start_codon:yes stop_codon:yes gene_type:complete
MDKKLLTPGPLTTSKRTKEAMLHDWGSRDKDFINLNHSIRKSLIKLIDGENDYQCVPMQGSGTFAVESMISSLTPKNAKILILINGAYGQRMKKMCDYINKNYIDYVVPENTTHDLIEIEKIIESNKDLTHIFAVYCETTSGILNPVQEIAELAEKKNLSLFIDAMSAFGALPLNSKKTKFDALAASSNKCLEGVPGVGFVLMKNEVIKNAKGNCHSLSLDLYDQWQAMEQNKQWRFTPPTHVLAAFSEAIKEHEKEGGIYGRYKRYSNNCKIICEGMKKIGFKQLLTDELQAPIIITFMQPKNSNFNFQKFYDALSQKDFLIYPGKLTVAETFRIGCIGSLNDEDMHSAISAIKEVLKELQVNIS